MLEWTAALCSILGVWLMARRRLAAWPVGLLSVALYGLVFAEAKLYSDTLLQVAFGGFLVYGWLNWRQHAADEGSIRIVPLARGTLLRDLSIGLCGGVALGAAMHSFTDAALPWLDALLTGLSLVGQWWQARRHVACWWVWIAVDVVYVGAYLFKSLHVTAGCTCSSSAWPCSACAHGAPPLASHRWQPGRATPYVAGLPVVANLGWRACRPRSASTQNIHAWRGSTG